MNLIESNEYSYKKNANFSLRNNSTINNNELSFITTKTTIKQTTTNTTDISEQNLNLTATTTIINKNFLKNFQLLKNYLYTSTTKESPPASSTTSFTSSSSDSKLYESINLLKNIIDKLSKLDSSRDNSRKHDSSDSFENLFALAKNSVTLSFKDYILLQKTTNPFQNREQLSSTSIIKPENLASKIHSYYHSLTTSSIYTTKIPSSLIEMLNLVNKNNSYFSNNNPMFSNYSINSSYSNENYQSATSDIDLELFNDPINPLGISTSNNSSLLIGIAFFYSILIITSLTSNPLLIYVLLWRRKAQIKLIDIFVANLSLSDLFLTILNIPLCLIIYFSEQWPFGSLLCQLGTFSTSCSIYVNIFTMAYISIDRYFAVTRPLLSNPNYQRKKSILLDNHTRHKIYIVLTLIWIIAIILSVPQFLFSKVSSNESTGKSVFKEASNLTDFESFNLDIIDDHINLNGVEDPFKRCIIEYPHKNMKNIMVLVNFSLQYLIPSVVILYFYGKIIYHLYLNLNVEELMDSPHNHEKNYINKHNNANKKEKKTSLVNKSKSDFNLGIESRKQLLNKSKSSILNNQQAGKMTRKKSRMRIEGLNRTRNLKKSIKTMIIIIALFLLSWLPIHLYRMATTFYPIILNYIEDRFSSARFDTTSSSSPSWLNLSLVNATNIPLISLNASMVETCRKNETYKDCLINALKDLRDSSDTNNLTFKINTLHNRYVFFFCYFMAMSSVCYNPIVYFWMHKKFRTEVKDLFTRIFSFSFKSQQEEVRRTSLIQANLPRSSIQTTNSLMPGSKTTKFSLLSKQSVLNENEQSLLHKHRRMFRKTSKKRAAQPSYMSSFKIRNKRFSSLSSESTASSSKKSEC